MAMRALLMIGLMALVACSGSTDATTTSPPPATAEEMEIFCARYAEVENLDYQAKYEALLEVAPAEIEGPLFRVTNNPGPTEDDTRVEEFLDRCES